MERDFSTWETYKSSLTTSYKNLKSSFAYGHHFILFDKRLSGKGILLMYKLKFKEVGYRKFVLYIKEKWTEARTIRDDGSFKSGDWLFCSERPKNGVKQDFELVRNLFAELPQYNRNKLLRDLTNFKFVIEYDREDETDE